MENYTVFPISYEMTKPWILKRHYAKRMPSISHAFGLFEERELVGVITYGIPASPFLCKGVCGEEWKDNVLELNRLVLLNNKPNEASFLVGKSLKLLPKPTIIVSYADTKWKHIGYVYQATNWIYTGCTKERTDMFSEAGHSRHNDGNPEIRQDRSAKHRYIFFVADKNTKKKLMSKLNYKIQSYPKGDSIKYIPGDTGATQTLMLLPS